MFSVYQTHGFYRMKMVFFFKRTVWIFDRMWNNDANFLATTSPISTPLHVDEFYSCEEQPPTIFCGIAASSRNCKRNHEWHIDVAKLMTSPIRRLRPQWIVSPSLTLWGVQQSLWLGQMSSHRGLKGGIGTITSAISSIKHEYDDLLYCFALFLLLLSNWWSYW